MPGEEVLEGGRVVAGRAASSRQPPPPSGTTSNTCRSSTSPFLKPLSRKRAPIVSGCVSGGSVAGLAPVADVLVQVIAHDLGLERRAVQIEPDAGGAARAVVGHHQVRPFVEGQRTASRGRRSRCPARNESSPKNGRPSIERQLEAAAAGIGPRAGLMQDDGAVLRSVGFSRRLERERHRCGRTAARPDGRRGCRR